MQPSVKELEENFLKYLNEAGTTLREGLFIKLSNHINRGGSLEDKVSSLIRNNNTEKFIRHLLKDSSEEDVLSALKVSLMYKNLGRKRNNVFIQQILLAYCMKGTDGVKAISRVFDSYSTYRISLMNDMYTGVIFMQNLAMTLLHEGEKAAYSLIDDYEEKFKLK